MADLANAIGETQSTASAEDAKLRKRAVVVIHGIGNQSPMATLREFVESVWSSCKGLALPPPPRTWTKRDLMSNNYELRRITTNSDTSGRRTDFFEFYWADQMEDTRLADVIWWLKRLFWRPSDRVPPAVSEVWLAGIVALLLLACALGVLAWLVLHTLQAIPSSIPCAFLWLAAATSLALVLWLARHVVLVQVVGDAARYLTASPANIAARARIRTSGIKLLTALHDNNDYDRIIFACHSLGTVIGYDILNFYWSTINGYVHHARHDQALTDIEGRIRELRASPEDPVLQRTYRDAQRRYAEAVRRASGNKWKVTDFVTLGSPLTYAPLLMVDDRDPLLESDKTAIETGRLAEWRRRLDPKTRTVAALLFARMAQREFPICPPLPETGDSFTYAAEGGDYLPHHAAVFAPVRWTNIFAPCRQVIWGDVIGGPVAPIFGPGVKDVALTGDVGTTLLAHTHYWDQRRTDEKHIAALRSALNVLDEDDAVAWQSYEAGARS